MNSLNILQGPGYQTFNGGNYRYDKGGMKAKFKKVFREVTAEEFGRFDSVQYDRMIEISGRLWSGYENISALFPSAAFAPVIGGRLYGSSNLPLICNGQDGSRLTVVNTQITKLANLMLAVEADLFSADVTFTGLLLSGGSPQTADDYYTYTIGNSYTAPSFSKSNFRAPVLSAAWAGTATNQTTSAGITSFAAFNFRKGAAIDWKWDVNFKPWYIDGLGTTDASCDGFEASCKGTPIGGIETDAAAVMLPNQALGVLESTNGGDLTLTFGSNSIILKAAFVADHEGFAWSRENNRIGDMTWRTTVPFSSGAPTARASVS